MVGVGRPEESSLSAMYSATEDGTLIKEHTFPTTVPIPFLLYNQYFLFIHSISLACTHHVKKSFLTSYPSLCHILFLCSTLQNNLLWRISLYLKSIFPLLLFSWILSRQPFFPITLPKHLINDLAITKCSVIAQSSAYYWSYQQYFNTADLAFLETLIHLVFKIPLSLSSSLLHGPSDLP